jgi:chemotaxis protein MotB
VTDMALRERKNRAQDGGINPSGWMTTFSDLCTLLLTFFVLLFSFNSMDDRKLKAMFGNFTAGSGVMSFKEYRKLTRPREALIEDLQSFIDKRVVEAETPRTGKDDVDLVSDEFEGTSSYLEISPISDGFKIIFGAETFFASAEAEIREDMKPALDTIADFLRATAYRVYVQGHTDDIPIRGGAYSSNEELSTARALVIAEYLMRQGDVPASAVAAIGLGEREPLASNEDPAGRSRNRRVEIICKNKSYYH